MLIGDDVVQSKHPQILQANEAKLSLDEVEHAIDVIIDSQHTLDELTIRNFLVTKLKVLIQLRNSIMKIAIFGTRGIPNLYGGFEQFAQYLSEGLCKHGHDVYVYNSHDHNYQEKNGKK